MKHDTKSNEGPKAFEHFRDAVKTIFAVPKNGTTKRTKTTTKRKTPAADKG